LERRIGHCCPGLSGEYLTSMVPLPMTTHQAMGWPSSCRRSPQVVGDQVVRPFGRYRRRPLVAGLAEADGGVGAAGEQVVQDTLVADSSASSSWPPVAACMMRRLVE
jgi:hypothetical protein